MKSIIALIAIVALVSAQNPVPVPAFNNISSLNGNWYVVWSFESNANRSESANDIPPNFEFSCYTWDVDVNSDGGQIEGALTFGGQTKNYTIPVEVYGTPNSIWDEVIYWVAVDPVAQSWATVGIVGNSYDNNTSSGFILSRSPTLNNLVLNANIALLKGEQFNIQSTNQLNVSNANCPATSF